MGISVQRGDVVIVKFDPTVGREIQKSRPAIVVSHDEANLNVRNQILVVVPLTRVRPDRGPHPDEVVIEAGEGGLDLRSTTVSRQVRSVDRTRIIRRIGTVSADTLQTVDQRLQQVLALA